MTDAQLYVWPVLRRVALWSPLVFVIGVLISCSPAEAQTLKPPCQASVVAAQVDTPAEEALLAADVECLARAAALRADVLQKLAVARQANMPVPVTPPIVPPGTGDIWPRFEKAFAGCGFLLLRSGPDQNGNATWIAYKQLSATVKVGQVDPNQAPESEPVVRGLLKDVWTAGCQARDFGHNN